DFSALQACFVTLTLHSASTPEQVVERLRGAQVAISNKVPLTEPVLPACPDLRLVLVSAPGTNNVDLAAARARGITVCDGQGYGTASVAQPGLALMLALATGPPDYRAAVRAGRWQQAPQFWLLDFPSMELHGK